MDGAEHVGDIAEYWIVVLYKNRSADVDFFNVVLMLIVVNSRVTLKRLIHEGELIPLGELVLKG